MMGCRRIQKRLKSFSDGEVGSFRKKAAIERHLGKCVRCRQALEEIHALERLLEAYEEIDLPEHGLAGPVLARVRKESGLSMRPSASLPTVPLRVRFFSPYGWATAGLFLAGILAGQVIAASIRQTPLVQDEQSELSQQAINLEIFSEIPPDSLEQRFWEALSAGQGGNG